jgi:eukaryotic-like serine/threonine-protein kinase
MATKGKTYSEKTSLVGEMLGDYRMEQILASGGMARIYKATDTNLERTVAVKVLMRELMELDDSLIERFEREAKAVAALEHDNIIRIYDYRRKDDLYYIVMNYVEGNDLADEINDLRRAGKLMDIQRALRILSQVASALDFAHAAGIIHRDVKPSNILIDKHDKAILTDFGLVLRQSKDKTMGTAFGTPRYISPEQALASEKSVPQSDIYSLAVIVYEILTGDMLFRADTPMQIALSHISEAPPKPTSINPDIPESVEREILKALDKDPIKRHRSATEFVNALKEAYASAQPTSPAPVEERPPADIRTPVFPEASAYKQAVKAAVSQPAKEAPPVQPSPKRNTDEWTLSVPPQPVQVESPAPKTSKRSPLPMIGGAVVLVGIVAAVIVALMSSGGGSTETANNSTTPAATAQAAIPLIADGLPVKLQYDSTTLIIHNMSDTDLELSQLVLAKADDEAGIEGAKLRQKVVPAGQCVGLIQTGRDFSAREYDCLVKDHIEMKVPGTLLFWRTPLPTEFEVRYGEEVLQRCTTIRRDGTGECQVNLPKPEGATAS